MKIGKEYLEMKDMGDVLKEFATLVISNLVPTNSEVDINVVKSTKNIIIQVKVPKENRGRIIGKNGLTIESLKNLFISVKNINFPEDRRKVNIEILEEEDYFVKSK